MTTIHDDLDAAIPEAPALPSVEDSLRTGQTALRRRRQGTAGLVAGLAVVALVTATGLSGGGTGNAGPAVDPTVAPTVSETPWTPDLIRDNPDWATEDQYKGTPVLFDYDGVLLINPAVHVVRRWDDPETLPAPQKSVAMVVERNGKTYWMVSVSEGGLQADGTGGVGSWTSDIEPSEAHGVPFEQWVYDTMAMPDGYEPDPELVHYESDGRLTPVGDATILAQTSDVPKRVVPPQADEATVGLVQVGHAKLCVYVAQAPGHDPEYFFLPASQFGPDLAGCIATMPGWNLSL